MENMSFVSAMKAYFGFHPGQTLTEFAQELKALSVAERAWFKANLPSVGYNVTV